MNSNLIGKRIRLYRQLAKLTQEELAEKANVSETYIRKLEAAQRTPSLEMTLILAAALKTTPDHLLLSSSNLSNPSNTSIVDLLNDCTPAEFSILYENMAELKRLLRSYPK